MPCTPERDCQWRGSPTAISLHPSTTLEAFEGEEPEGERSSSESRARSLKDEPAELSSFSSFKTQLQLVQWDLVRVLKLPTDAIPEDSSRRRSFKTRAGGEETCRTPFPTLPLDRLEAVTPCPPPGTCRGPPQRFRRVLERDHVRRMGCHLEFTSTPEFAKHVPEFAKHV